MLYRKFIYRGTKKILIMQSVKKKIKSVYNISRDKLDRYYGEAKMNMRKGFLKQGHIVRYHNGEQGNEVIRTSLESPDPTMVARYGLYELKVVAGVLLNKPHLVENTFFNLCNNAGFFPPNLSLLDRFVDVYISATKQIDCFAVWNYRHGLWGEEQHVFGVSQENTKLIDIDALNFFKHDIPWTYGLKNKKILVIHPFTKTINLQYYNKRKELFSNPRTLPEFAGLESVTAVQSAAGAGTRFANWFDALESMKDEVSYIDFDIALIGAGAYGLPLAAHVKNMGKKAIHMGGVSQVLFGIKGKRWQSNYGYLFNSAWVHPDESETPQDAERVDGGCYW